MQVILDGLRWLGLDWDEGPEREGGYGPYFQSQRNAVYEEYFSRLLDKGVLYEDGGSMRFRSPREPVRVKDLVCGDIEFDRSHEPDMTIRRPDGSWIFHFVNVVDDISMGINTVIRGEDHLSNTPKHLELYHALEATPPQFAHIPLILNRDGSKMSKRDAGASLTTYMDKGYVPEAVRNYLCLLGWSSKDDREKLDIHEVIERFDIAKLNRGNAAFDPDKLLWLAGEYARELPPARFFEMGRSALRKARVPVDAFPVDYVQRALETCEGKVRVMDELVDYAGFYFSDDYPTDAEAAEKQFTAANKPRIAEVRAEFGQMQSFTASEIESVLKSTAAKLGVKVGVLIHPTRLACTGSPSGPSLYHLLEVLGRDKVLARLDHRLAEDWSG